MNDSSLVFRVVDWDGRYETARSLRKSGPRAEIAVATNLGGGAIARLLDLPDSATLLGVWYFIQAVAANCERRGALAQFGVPLSAVELARLSGWDVPLIERALATLCSPELGLLEQVSCDEALRPPVIPPPAPRKPRNPKPPPFTHCPICNADLVTLANTGSVGHVANAASVREPTDADAGRGGPTTPPTERDFQGELEQIRKMREQLSSGEAAPEVVERFINSHAARLEATSDSHATSNRPQPPQPETEPVMLKPTPVVRTDNRLKPRRKKCKSKAKQMSHR